MSFDEDRKRNAVVFWADSHVPEMFLGKKTFEPGSVYHKVASKFTEQAGLLLDPAKEGVRGYIFGLAGDKGAGKTTMGVELVRHCCELGRIGKYCKMKEYFRATTERNPDWAAIRARYEDPRLLVIDEIGRTGDNSWVQDELFHLVNVRNENNRWTILISPGSPLEMASYLGPSLVDRLKATGPIIELKGKSQRKKG